MIRTRRPAETRRRWDGDGDEDDDDPLIRKRRGTTEARNLIKKSHGKVEERMS